MAPESRRRPCQTRRQEVAVTEQRVVINECLPVVTDSDLNFLFLWYIYTAEMYRYTPNNAEATPTKFFHNLIIVAKLRSDILVQILSGWQTGAFVIFLRNGMGTGYLGQFPVFKIKASV